MPERTSTPDVALAPWLGAAIFALFVVISLSAGLVFHISTVALPKIVDERFGGDISIALVGGLTTAIFMCGALAQFSVGRLVEKFPLHLLFAAVALLQFLGLIWAAYATGTMVLIALAVTVAAIYGQVTINDLVIARYTADAWRGRVFAARYFLTFLVVGCCGVSDRVPARPWRLRPRADSDGRDCARFRRSRRRMIAALVNGAERERARIAAPAE